MNLLVYRRYYRALRRFFAVNRTLPKFLPRPFYAPVLLDTQLSTHPSLYQNI
jgi:hypothetical protein